MNLFKLLKHSNMDRCFTCLCEENYSNISLLPVGFEVAGVLF